MRNVGERASSLLAGLNRMRADAAALSIPPEELRGATITLSNFGMIAGHFAGLVVVPPRVAIVGAAAPNSALSSKAANRRDPDPGASNSSPFRGVVSGDTIRVPVWTTVPALVLVYLMV